MSDDTTEHRPSKSERKREMHEMQSLAEGMSGLSNAELTKLGISNETIRVLAEIRQIRASGARNRQIKYAVKHLLNENLDEVTAYLDDRQSQHVAANRQFHELERWRDRLLQDGDDAFGAILDRWPTLDRQHLRQLIREAQKDHHENRHAGAGRKLFRYLREVAEADG